MRLYDLYGTLYIQSDVNYFHYWFSKYTIFQQNIFLTFFILIPKIRSIFKNTFKCKTTMKPFRYLYPRYKKIDYQKNIGQYDGSMELLDVVLFFQTLLAKNHVSQRFDRSLEKFLITLTISDYWILILFTTAKVPINKTIFEGFLPDRKITNTNFSQMFYIIQSIQEKRLFLTTFPSVYRFNDLRQNMCNISSELSDLTNNTIVYPHYNGFRLRISSDSMNNSILMTNKYNIKIKNKPYKIPIPNGKCTFEVIYMSKLHNDVEMSDGFYEKLCTILECCLVTNDLNDIIEYLKQQDLKNILFAGQLAILYPNMFQYHVIILDVISLDDISYFESPFSTRLDILQKTFNLNTPNVTITEPVSSALVLKNYYRYLTYFAPHLYYLTGIVVPSPTAKYFETTSTAKYVHFNFVKHLQYNTLTQTVYSTISQNNRDLVTYKYLVYGVSKSNIHIAVADQLHFQHFATITLQAPLIIPRKQQKKLFIINRKPSTIHCQIIVTIQHSEVNYSQFNIIKFNPFGSLCEVRRNVTEPDQVSTVK